MQLNSLRQLAQATAAIADAVALLGTTDFAWECWQQTWPDTSCGFGGIAGQAFTNACTVVVHDPESEAKLVYHRGAFAYRVERPSDKFADLYARRALPGMTDAKEREALEYAG